MNLFPSETLTILDIMIEGCLVLNENQECCYINNRAADILSLNIKDTTTPILGKPFFSLFPHLQKTVTDSYIRQAVLKKTSITFEAMWDLTNPDQWLYIKLSPQANKLFVFLVENSFQHQMIDDTRLNELHFRRLAESLPQVVWTASPNGSVDYYNSRWYEFTGLSFDASKDTGWRLAVHPDDFEITKALWQHSLATGENFTCEMRLKQGSNGEYLWHLARSVAIKNKAGDIIKWLGTSTNIHEQKMLDHKKDEFISIASHELKTPLTSIKGFSQMLERRLLKSRDSKNKQYIAITLRYVEKLEKLINDLLDVSRIQAGKMQFDLSKFEVDALVKEAVESLSPISPQHQMILRGSTQTQIIGDRSRLEQVIINILTNAMRYSPQADKVIIQLERDDEHVRISVTDFGIGIPGTKVEKIFQRFYRASESLAQSHGLGIGLYISMEIVSRHGGTITVESEPKKGSTFHINLPLIPKPATV